MYAGFVVLIVCGVVALLVAAVAVLGPTFPSAPGYVEQSAALAFAILMQAVATLPLADRGVVSPLWLSTRPRALPVRPRGEADPDPTADTTLR
jgi:hypothetical protein